MSEEVYTSGWNKKQFRFNDHVVMEMVSAPDEKRTGRLIQVRKGCGQFGSDLYLVRLRDGSLMSFENVMMRRVDDTRFEENFYRSNGHEPPVVPDQPINEEDSVETEYTLQGKWAETGFIIEKPQQPETPGSFSMCITMPDKKETHELPGNT